MIELESKSTLPDLAHKNSEIVASLFDSIDAVHYDGDQHYHSDGEILIWSHKELTEGIKPTAQEVSHEKIIPFDDGFRSESRTSDYDDLSPSVTQDVEYEGDQEVEGVFGRFQRKKNHTLRRPGVRGKEFQPLKPTKKDIAVERQASFSIGDQKSSSSHDFDNFTSGVESSELETDFEEIFATKSSGFISNEEFSCVDSDDDLARMSTVLTSRRRRQLKNVGSKDDLTIEHDKRQGKRRQRLKKFLKCLESHSLQNMIQEYKTRQKFSSVDEPAIKFDPRLRRQTVSHISQNKPFKTDDPRPGRRVRRLSHDQKSDRKFLVDVKQTRNLLLSQENTQKDCKITILDGGPKTIQLKSLFSGGARTYDIRGTYFLSNLLQELAIANLHGWHTIVLGEEDLTENPPARLSRLIRMYYWSFLSRTIDGKGIRRITQDTKFVKQVAGKSKRNISRIYVPHEDNIARHYFTTFAKKNPDLRMKVVTLPKIITPEYVASINSEPGILSLKLKVDKEAEGGYVGNPFVVPGGRFNEMYGWDSYFIVLGLINDGYVGLAKSMVENLSYEIEHYGKILNANRSYYLTRSQPPFLTDMANAVFQNLNSAESDKICWLKEIYHSAIKEYYSVWMSSPRIVEKIKLSRYCGETVRMPPETEHGHFDNVLRPFAAEHKMNLERFTKEYQSGKIKVPELDNYFMHDSSVRESGHDTTYRLDGRSANLCTVDLNALLYKYEMDIGEAIRDHFDGQFENEVPEIWFQRAENRKQLMDRYMWNEELGFYFDYNFVEEKQTYYESSTTFYPLWAGCASLHQCNRLIESALPKLEMPGGIVGSTEESRGPLGIDRPARQWDYPYGWSPHQIIAWEGFFHYNKPEIARRLAYRWLLMATMNSKDFNGVVPEKYNVVTKEFRVNVEYGNVGVDFKFISDGGFGWMNSSYQIGLHYLTPPLRKALGGLVSVEQAFRRDLFKKSEVEKAILQNAEAFTEAAAACALSTMQSTVEDEKKEEKPVKKAIIEAPRPTLGMGFNFGQFSPHKRAKSSPIVPTLKSLKR